MGTNLTYRMPELLTRDWYVDVDVSKYAAYFVVALNHDLSVSSIIDPLKTSENLLANRKKKAVPKPLHPACRGFFVWYGWNALREGANPLRLCFANPPPPTGGGFALLTGRCQKAPPSGELASPTGLD